MSWKERLLDQYGYLFNIDGDYTSVCNFIEALLKETERNTAKEIFEMWDKTDWEEWDDYVASQNEV
jgi:hypothetical protein